MRRSTLPLKIDKGGQHIPKNKINAMRLQRMYISQKEMIHQGQN